MREREEGEKEERKRESFLKYKMYEVAYKSIEEFQNCCESPKRLERSTTII